MREHMIHLVRYQTCVQPVLGLICAGFNGSLNEKDWLLRSDLQVAHTYVPICYQICLLKTSKPYRKSRY